MIQHFNRYGYYIQTCLLVLMLCAVGIATGMVITHELEQQQVMTVLDASQAVDRGWPAEWGE